MISRCIVRREVIFYCGKQTDQVLKTIVFPPDYPMKKGPPRRKTKKKPLKKIIHRATKRLKKSIAAHDPRLHESRLGSMREPDAVCVTICTPKYRHLLTDAVNAFKQYLGLPVLVIECDDADGYARKLQLDMLAGPRKIVFCDLDWRPIRPLPKVWESGAWCAVRDHGYKHPHSFASHDIEAHGLDALSYFNSGFFCCDLANPAHSAVFSMARAIWRDVQEKHRPRVGDFGDQFYLNAALQELRVAAQMLPVAFNWIRGYVEHGMFPYIPRTIYAVHAAGVPVVDKLDHLTMMQQAHGYNVAPICHGVAEEFLAMGVELQ
jgi:hypothetical protein